MLCCFPTLFPPSICQEQLLQAASWFHQQRVMSLSLGDDLVCLSIKKSSGMYQCTCTPCCGTRSRWVLEVLHGPELMKVYQGGHWPLPFKWFSVLFLDSLSAFGFNWSQFLDVLADKGLAGWECVCVWETCLSVGCREVLGKPILSYNQQITAMNELLRRGLSCSS